MSNKKFLGVEELAEHLSVKKSFIYDLTYKNAIPHYKIGRLVRFSVDEIEEWLRAKKKGTDQLITNDIEPKNIGIDQEK